MITPWLPLSTRLRMLLRMLTIQGSYNYESMIGTGMAFVMEPALRLLPGGRGGDAYRDAMARQSRYFNAHPYFASVAVGTLNVISVGFGILSLSKFVPTVLFGMLIGLASAIPLNLALILFIAPGWERLTPVAWAAFIAGMSTAVSTVGRCQAERCGSGAGTVAPGSADLCTRSATGDTGGAGGAASAPVNTPTTPGRVSAGSASIDTIFA